MSELSDMRPPLWPDLPEAVDVERLNGLAGEHHARAVRALGTREAGGHLYDEDQAVALVSLIAMINATNRLGVILDNQGGAYEPGALAGVAD
ncbi:hypothetical protein IPZ68_35165 [Streptomyces arenae]|nr:hypothetical protein [Streptomyces arenae]